MTVLTQADRSIPPKPRSADQTIARLLASGLLLVNFVVTFLSWKPQWLYMANDEDVWVSNAAKFWKAGVGSPIVHVPLFHDLIGPFVGGTFVDLQTGFVIWRCVLYLVAIALMFLVLTRISNLWVAFAFTVHFEWLLWFYDSPTYMVLAMTFFLGAMALVTAKRKFAGLAVGVLALGALVRLELLFFVITALVLLVMFSRKAVFSWGFCRQLLVPAVIFVMLIYWHGSSLTRFPRDYSSRGQRSVVWYLIDYLYSAGAFHKYTNVSRGEVTPSLINSVLVEHFGKNLNELSSSSFLYLWRRNPGIMKARYASVFRQLPVDVKQLFSVMPLYGKSQPLSCYGLLTAFVFVSVLLGMVWSRKSAGFAKRALDALGFLNIRTPPGACPEFFAIVLSGFAGFVPWLMTLPEPYYMIVSMPTAYLGTAWAIVYIAGRLQPPLYPEAQALTRATNGGR